MNKPRIIPDVIFQLEALLRRLPESYSHRDTIEKDLATYKKGFRGEQEVDRYLRFLEWDPYFLIKGIRLPDRSGGYFQIDSLLLTPQVFCLFEIKNWAGVVSFNPALKQATRKLNSHSQEEGFSDPISQVHLQRSHLRQFLHHPSIPIVPFVIMSHPSTMIKIENNAHLVSEVILHAHAILDRLSLLKDKTAAGISFDNKSLRKIWRTLLKSHSPRKDDVLKKYGVDPRKLIVGVRCTKCNKYPMSRLYGSWRCAFCGATSKLAHVRALEDYLLLFGENITNQQARWFLHVDSPDVVKYLLTKMGLSYSGETRHRVYHLPKQSHFYEF